MRFAAISDKGIVRDVNEQLHRIITGQDGVQTHLL